MESAAKTLPINWQDRPRGGFSPLDKILRIDPGRAYELTILVPRIVGCDTHYIDGRTVPCTELKAPRPRRCHVEHRDTSSRWQGWLAVQAPRTPVVKFLCVTQAAGRDNPWLTDKDRNLRGLTVTVQRMGSHKQSKLTIRASSQVHEGQRLCAAPDMIAFLVNLWGPMVMESLERENARSANPLLYAGESR